MSKIWPVVFALSLAVSQAHAQLTPQMTGAFPLARDIRALSPHARAQAAKTVLNLAVQPRLGRATALTPNAPFGPGGAYLSFWKPSFVLGTSAGGEAGVNFWNIHTQGHINIGFNANAGVKTLLDCRVLAGNILFKVYRDAGDAPTDQEERRPRDGHLFVLVAPSRRATAVSVELWPLPNQAEMGFLGCDLQSLR